MVALRGCVGFVIFFLLVFVSSISHAEIPKNFQAQLSGVSSNNVTLTWTKVVSQEFIDGSMRPHYAYYLWHKAPGSSTWLLNSSLGTTAVNRVINGLAVGQHEFKLSAVYGVYDQDYFHHTTANLIVAVTDPASMPPAFSINNASVLEGAQITFTVSKSHQTSTPYNVSYRTEFYSPERFSADDSDLVPVSGVLTFSGNELQKTIVVPTIQDSTSEYYEQFKIVLFSPTGNSTLTRAVGIGTINTDDPELPLPVDEYNSGQPSTSNDGEFVVSARWEHDHVTPGNKPTWVEIERKKDNGVWVQVSSQSWKSGTYTYAFYESISVDGMYKYRTRSCKNVGCSPWKESIFTTVLGVGIASESPQVIPHDLSVNRQGFLNLAIPIRSLIGVNGLEPRLALVHNTANGLYASKDETGMPSPVARGWGLNGIPFIETCDSGSAYCLDGQFLIDEQSGVKTINGDYYRLESNGAIRLRKLVASGGQIRFVMWDGDHAYVFGDTDATRLVRSVNGKSRTFWFLREITDQFDNVLTVAYEKVHSSYSGSHVIPRSVQYGGYSVEFEYQNRTVPIEHRYAVSPKALSKVRTKISSVSVGEYNLAYRFDSGNPLLRTLQYCGYDQGGLNKTCGQVTRFEYHISSQAPDGVYNNAFVSKLLEGVGTTTTIVYENESVRAANQGFNNFSEKPFPYTHYSQTNFTNCATNLSCPSAHQVVAVLKSNGIGGENKTEYAYGNASPINQAVRTKLPDGTYIYTKYFGTANQSVEPDPWRGGLEKRERYLSKYVSPSATTLLSRTDWDWTKVSPTGKKYSFPYVRKQRDFIVDYGVVAGAVVTTTSPVINHSTGLVEQWNIKQNTGYGWQSNDTFSSLQKTVESTVALNNITTNWSPGFVTSVEERHSNVPGETGIKTLTSNFTRRYQTLAVASMTSLVGTDNESRLALSYGYNGQVISQSVTGLDIETRTSASVYSSDPRYPNQVRNAEAHTTYLQFDKRFGKPSQISKFSLTTDLTYDNLGNLIKTVQPGGAEMNRIIEMCDSSCEAVAGVRPAYKVMTSLTHPNEYDKGAPDQIVYYDMLGRIIRQETEGFSGEEIKVDTVYDNLGRVAKRSAAYSGSLANFTEFSYDIYGRQTHAAFPDGSSVTVQYQQLANKFVRQTISSSVHSGNGAIKSTQRREEYNILGQLIASYDAYNTPEQVLTEYGYDMLGNNDYVRVNGDNRTVITREYDLAGNVKSISDPSAGTVLFTSNVLGEVVVQEDARGIKTKFDYDRLGRLVKRIDEYDPASPNSGVVNTWTFDAQFQDKLARRASPNFIETLSYDVSNTGLPDAISTQIIFPNASSQNYTATLNYDGYGRPVSQQNAGTLLFPQYNDLGYQSALRLNSINGDLVYRINNMDVQGNVTSLTHGNGLVTNSQFDEISGLITEIETGNGAIQNLAYEWWSDGTLAQRDKIGSQSASEVFEYDALDRLKRSMTYHASGTRTLSFQYDALGNMTSKLDSVSGNNISGYNYTAANKPYQLSSVTVNGIAHSYSYDNSGNLTFDNAPGTVNDRRVGYNAIGKPELITKGASSNPSAQTRFEYGPDGKRYLQQKLNGDITIYLQGGQVEILYPAAGDVESVTKHYMGHALRQTTKARNSSLLVREMLYLHTDNLGSITAATRQNQTVAFRKDYDPFGSLRNANWSAPTNPQSVLSVRGFTGHEHLDDVGLIHMNGRVYDAQIGRFISADPIVQAPTFSQSYNRYAYVFNNPLSFTDPSGYCANDGWFDCPDDLWGPWGPWGPWDPSNIWYYGPSAPSDSPPPPPSNEIVDPNPRTPGVPGGALISDPQPPRPGDVVETAQVDRGTGSSGNSDGLFGPTIRVLSTALYDTAEAGRTSAFFGLGEYFLPKIDNPFPAQNNVENFSATGITLLVSRGKGAQSHHLIPKAVYEKFKTVLDPKYVRDHVKNLAQLPVPFHGNHPSYSNYVTSRLNELLLDGPLSLDRLAGLQKSLRSEVESLLKSGKYEKLNDYYKELGY